MKLPRAEEAVIDPRKLKDYVLSAEHPVGRYKAAFFIALGSSADEWERLEVELRELALHAAAALGERTSFGQKYRVRGRIEGPGGEQADVISVWIVLRGEEVPRFATVYPETTR